MLCAKKIRLALKIRFGLYFPQQSPQSICTVKFSSS